MRSKHRSASRRFVHAVMSMAIGTGMLAGATAITVLSTSSPAAAKTQTANCTFNGVGNQLQGSPTVLVPFMINGGAAVTPGVTQINIVCTGLPINTQMVVGIASPLAGFNSTTFTGTNALNEFMGGVSVTGPDEPFSSPTGTLTMTETVNADQQALNTDAVCPPSASQVALGLSNCAIAVADLPGNEYGFAYVNYNTSVSHPVTPWPGAYAVATAQGTGYASPPGLSVLNVTNTAAFTYGTALTTNAAASALDEPATTNSCPFNDLTGCTAIPVPTLGSAIAQGTVLLVGSLSGTHEIAVVNAPIAAGATKIWVNNLVNTYPSGTTVTPITGGSSAATAGDQVFLSGNGFWADPDGTLTEPLTVEVIDHLGTANVLATNTQSPEAIDPDIYTATNKGGGATFGSGGTFTGGTLGLLETIPAGGLGYGAGGPGTGSAAAFTGGTLTYVVVEPNVAPFNDIVPETTMTTTGAVAYSYDTVTTTCTTTCLTPGAPNPNPAPLGAIGVDVASYIPPALAVTTTGTLPNAISGTTYTDLATLAASGGYPSYTWALTTGSLTGSGLTLGSNGVISGTAATVGTYTFKATVTDSATPTANTAVSGTLTLNVLAAFAVTTTSLPGGSVSSAYSQTLAEVGGTGPFTWSLATGSLTACGLTLSSGGVISGTPSAAATCTFTAKVTDSASNTATSGTLSIVISTSGPGAPTGLGAVPGNGSVALSWTAPASNGGSPITSYIVLRGTSSGTETVLATGVTGTTYTDSTVTNGTTYFYEVEAVTAVATSLPSNEVSATPNSTNCVVGGYYRNADGTTTGTAGGSCTTILTIYAPVQGTSLSITEPNSSVTLSTVTLGVGAGTNNQKFANATGHMNSLWVSDDRGTLTGWTVTGQMETDFNNLTPTGNPLDNIIPADFLTWTPSLELETWGTTPGANTNTTPFCPTAGNSGPRPAPSCQGPSGAPAYSTITSPSVVGGTLPRDTYQGYNAGTGGVSSIPAEVFVGPTAVLNNMAGSPQILCEAPTSGGGGGFDCDADLSLAIPPWVAAGTYSAIMDIVVTGL
jgi:hypothetical protein